MAVKTPDVYVEDVFIMSLQEVPSGDDCHLIIVPVCPDKVNKPLVLPVQIVLPPLTDPPADTGSTVTVVVALAVLLLISVITTVKVSPSAAPLAIVFRTVLELNVAEPLLLHTHETASTPVSNKVTSAPAQIGPELLAMAVCPHTFPGINKKRPTTRRTLISLNSLIKFLIFN